MIAWRAVGASVTGRSHMARGRPCDDAHGWVIDETRSVFAVADGAGSRDHSGLGPHVAVHAVLDAAEPMHAVRDSEALVAMALRLSEAARLAVQSEANQLDVPADYLATTLCVALAAPRALAAVQIGGGFAVLQRAGGAVEAVVHADPAEYARETTFLTDPEAIHRAKTYSVDAAEVSALALSTDGLRYKLTEDPRTDAPFVPFLIQAWAYARYHRLDAAALAKLLDDLDDQAGDDKTLLLGVKDDSGAYEPSLHLSSRPIP